MIRSRSSAAVALRPTRCWRTSLEFTARCPHPRGPHPKGASAHVLTGPIYVEGAAPGDMLEVRILALEHRVPYGVNNSNHGTGVLPDLLPGPAAKIIKLDLARNVALFSDDLE